MTAIARVQQSGILTDADDRGGDDLLDPQEAAPPDSVPAGELSPPQLDHIGIAVRSIQAARVFYASLGVTVSAEETVEHERVKTATLPLGDTRIELLEPVSGDSVIGRFLTRRGEGLHHIAVRAGDVDILFERMRKQGIRVASDSIRAGAGGHRYFFIHPESTGGVLIEIVETASPDQQAYPR